MSASDRIAALDQVELPCHYSTALGAHPGVFTFVDIRQVPACGLYAGAGSLITIEVVRVTCTRCLTWLSNGARS